MNEWMNEGINSIPLKYGIKKKRSTWRRQSDQNNNNNNNKTRTILFPYALQKSSTVNSYQEEAILAAPATLSLGGSELAITPAQRTESLQPHPRTSPRIAQKAARWAATERASCARGRITRACAREPCKRYVI